MSVDFEIIIGTYEQFLLGYKAKNVDNIYNLERSFATHSHLASIRAVASNRHYLASAGADDSVFLYDMRYRIETGRLMHHNDTINCINFTPDASHVITGSNDGSIGMVRCGNWQLEKLWKSPHKGNSVNALTIHPTGKLALSVGGDGILRTWNLVKGRQAYATNLVSRLKLDAKNVTILRWSPNGDKYLLASQSKIDVYSIENAGICAEMSFDSRVVCVEFIKNNLLAIGHEDGKIRFWNISKDLNSLEIEAHEARVKCLAYKNKYLVSASSSGEVKLWYYEKKKLNVLSRTSCGARITCMTLTQLCSDPTIKKEEPKIQEEIKETRQNVFRMRQEVIIEDEDNQDTAKIAKSRKKEKKKSDRKREPEVSTIVEEFENKSSKKRKKENKIVNCENTSIELPKKKKRNLSVEKTDDYPDKKTKREHTKKISKDNVEEIENNDLTDGYDSSIKNKEKKKKKKKVKTTNIEKPSKVNSKKRKAEHVISVTTTGSSSKMKKKKLT